MDTRWWHAAWGLCLVQLSLAQIDLNVTCRYAGVFHVEKNGRYSISRTEAPDLCRAFNSTLPTMDQMKVALTVGFETCRYGFIEGHVVIPRIHPNAICAANNTGVYILTSNTSQYDTYCFNASAPPDAEDCTSVTDLPNSFEGPVTITIVNRDGTRYSKKGEYRTNPEDINPSTPADEDVSSGSPSERSTSGGLIFHTLLPTSHPAPNFSSAWGPDHTGHAPATSTDPKASAGREPSGDHEGEADRPSFSGSGTEDDEDFTSSSNVEPTPTTVPQPPADPHTGVAQDVDGTGPAPATTQQGRSQSSRGVSPAVLEEDTNQPPTSAPASSNRSDGRGGRRSESPPEDSTSSLEGHGPSHPTTKGSSFLPPGPSAQTEPPAVTEVTLGHSDSNVHRFPGHGDASADPSRGDHTTHGAEAAGHSSGSQDAGATTASGPRRRPQIPEWLIILASLLALALVLAVCIAVNSRRRCGQKKKLVINSGNGTVEGRKPSGLNGEAKSQEMVHLVNKEAAEGPDQAMTADEARNLQDVDMKIGV
ncbi:CD44 antigen isoform X2 [Tupaia chinensis]|uniref:CD44 antigen isoform X2 n=1 Tax=Tupaia chinensis TaxID=246437 RepID=UPI0003C8CC54|nr:CD44 antigen isoform X2 [Tupaia chinensis]